MNKERLRKTPKSAPVSHSVAFQLKKESRQTDDETAGWEPPTVSGSDQHYLSHSLQTPQENPISEPTEPPPLIQTKLTVGEPGDIYEQEADQVAKLVVQQINHPLPISPIQEKGLQMQPVVQQREAVGESEVSPELEGAINRAKGGGQPLEAGLQRSMGEAMGVDFSGVRVHTDAQADQLNRSLSARAFTTGQDLFFKQGEYQPKNRSGQELIAHELTHIRQQNGGGLRRQFIQNHPATNPSKIMLQAKFVAAGWREGAESLRDVIYVDKRALENEESKNSIDRLFQTIAQDIIQTGLLKTQQKEEIAAKEKLEQKEVLKEEEQIRKQKIKNRIQKYDKLIEGGEKAVYTEIEEIAKSDIDEGTITAGNLTTLLLLVNTIVNSVPEESTLEKPSLEASVYRETALIGVGPAIAEYLVSNRSSLNPLDTYIFGIGQPWDAKRSDVETRHIEHNHDLAAVSANPNALGLEDTRRTDIAVTEEIEQIMSIYEVDNSWFQVNVTRVEETDVGYKIVTTKGEYYAKQVVVGIGTGQERTGKDFDQVKTAHETATASMLNPPPSPVMTLNEFQGALEHGDIKIAGKKIIVSGANAGVDAVFTATQAGATVDWFLGSSGSLMYVEGMANTNIVWSKVEAIIPARATGSSDKPDSEDTDRVSATGTVDKKFNEEWVNKNVAHISSQEGGPSKPVAQKILEAGIKAGMPRQGYILVYATGADLSPVSQVLGETGKDAYDSYEPIFETGGSWIDTIDPSAPPQAEDKDKITQAYRKLTLAIKASVEDWKKSLSGLPSLHWNYLLPQTQKSLWDSWCNGAWLSGNEVKEAAQAMVRDRNEQQVVAYFKAHTEDKTKGIKIIGSTVSKIQSDLKRPEATDIIPSTHVGQVVDSGQHTVVREGVRDASGMIPTYTGSGVANYAYGGASEISSALAVKGLSAAMSSMVVAAVIQERTVPNFINPKGENNAGLFQQRWEAIVQHLPIDQ